MSSKIWNRKVWGLPGALIVFLGIICDRVLNYIFLVFHKGNFNKCQSGTIFYRGLIYRYPQNIAIGKNCIINKNVTFGSEFEDSFLIIKNNVSIARCASLDFSGGLTIDDHVTISSNVVIFTHDHGLNPMSVPVKKELLIEKNVWIGSNAIILQNVNVIGENAVIAAGSIITKNIPANAIVAGNPAKIIRYRNE